MKLKFGDKRSIEYVKELERKALEKKIKNSNKGPHCRWHRDTEHHISYVYWDRKEVIWSTCEECAEGCKYWDGTDLEGKPL